MPLRPKQSFNLTVAFTALALLAEGALLWKLGHDQSLRTPQLTAPPASTAPLVAATSPPLFALPETAPGKPAPVAPSLTAPPAGAAPSSSTLPADKRALAKSYFDAGTAALQRKDNKGATENFLKVVEVAPNHLATRLNLAVLYLGAKQPESALPHLQKAVQIAPKNAATQFELGRTLVTLRRPQEAIEPLRKSVQLAPNEIASRDLLAQIYLSQKKPLEAYRQWTALAQSQPRNVDAHLQAANLAGNALKRPAEAEKWLRLAITNAPRDPRPAIILGRYLLGAKKSKQAAQVIGQAAKARPDVFEIYPLLGEARLGAGDLSGARSAFQSALLRLPVAKTDADKKEVARVEANLRFSLGRVLGRSKKPKEALAEFRRVAKLAPGDAEVQSLIGLAASQTGDRKGAIAALNEALKLDPKRANDHLLLAQLQEQSNNWSAANEHYETYVRLQPRDEGAIISWAFAARRAKKYEQELKVWDRFAKRAPKKPFPLMQSGVVLRELKRPAEALAKFERALAIDGKDPNVLYEVARLQTQLKRPSDATSTWKKLIAARPDYLPAYASLLASSAQSGDESSTRLFLARKLAGEENPKALSEVLRYYEKTKKNAEAKALLTDIVKRNPKARSAKAALDSFEAPAPAETKAEATPTPTPTPAATP